ncbi:MAG: GIY-YIG nuclease family protein [Candidatus Paceibacterota bacterium]
MKRSDLTNKKLPDAPGVYFFKHSRQILYIGKATSLRDRVRSYFTGDIELTRGQRIRRMTEEATNVTYQSTDSVIEALVLEAALIKQYQPLYNVREKDNKSFTYVVITDEEYPRVLTVRGRELDHAMKVQASRDSRPGPQSRSTSVATILRQTPIKKTFGPFTSGRSLQEALKIIRRIFPYRDRKCIPAGQQKDPDNPRPCFNRQLGLCPGVCTGEIPRRDYQRHIRNIVLFFEGKKRQLVKKLETEMNRAAQQRAFEHAATLKNQLYALTHINETALLTRDFLAEPKAGEKLYRVEAYDVAHLAGSAHVGVMTVVEDGAANTDEYRKFLIRGQDGANDTKALREILSRRLTHPEWRMPQLIVVDGGKAQKNAAERLLTDVGVSIPVVAVVKDERHKPRDLIGDARIIKRHQDMVLLANSESHRYAISFHRRRLRKDRL